MKIFNILRANEEVKNLTEQVSDLTKLNEQLTKEVELLKQREAAYTIGVQDWASEKENLIKGNEQAISELKAKYEKEIEDLKNTVKEEQASVSAKAASLVASIGLEPDTVKVSPNEINGNGMVKSPYQYIDHQNK